MCFLFCSCGSSPSCTLQLGSASLLQAAVIFEHRQQQLQCSARRLSLQLHVLGWTQHSEETNEQTNKQTKKSSLCVLGIAMKSSSQQTRWLSSASSEKSGTGPVGSHPQLLQHPPNKKSNPPQIIQSFRQLLRAGGWTKTKPVPRNLNWSWRGMQRCILSICKGEDTLRGRQLRVQLISNQFRKLRFKNKVKSAIGRGYCL